MRSNIEAQIKAKMGDVIEARNNCRISFNEKHSTSCGFSKFCWAKLQAEQDAMRMEFVLQQENSKQKGKLLKQKEQEILKNSSRRSK
jgi:predicted GIY-YIG superfamily endonuclease